MKLDNDRKQEIEAIAGTALQTAFPSGISLPINVQGVAKSYGIAIKIGKFNNKIEGVDNPEQISGVFIRSGNIILVSETNPYHRTMFTIAHELGHYLLHQDIIDQEVFYRLDAELIDTKEKSIQEMEANWFAASLLMPRSSVEKYAKIYANDIDHLSVRFAVSNSAMFWRLKNLHLLQVSNG